VVNDLPAEWPRVPLAAPPTLEEHVETDRITITGCRPGHPVLVRISYHPRWVATTGEKVWLAGPSFMLVVPKGDRVDLVYDGGFWVRLGHTFTTVGMLLFAAALFAPVRRRAAQAVTRLGELAPSPIMAPVRLVQTIGAWSIGRRRRLLTMGLAAAAVVFSTFAVVAYVPSVEGVYRAGQKTYDAGQLDEALPYFQEAQRVAPLSATAIHATYYEAIIHFRKERWAESEKVFRRLIATFPEAPNAPEALYHIGICRLRQGDIPGARDAWQQTQTRFPTTPWSGYAKDRLAEIASR
jgi:tetratricopeptide (TPR) repeat protein